MHKTFFDLSLELLCIANVDGYFEVVNPAFEATLGWSTEDLCSRPFVDFVHPDDVEATLAEVSKLSEGHAAISFENRYQCADGTYRWLSWMTQPDTNTGKLYAVARDVTASKEMQAALIEAREAAEQANVAKSAFLANMSHELRTPLTAIIGYTEMLLDAAEAEGNGHYSKDLTRVRAAGKQLLELINEVLDLSKVEAGQIELYFEDVDPVALCSGVMESMRPLLTERGNTFEFEADDTGLIITDLVRLRQIVTNVLSNAIKFSENSPVRVAIERPDGASFVEIQVSDRGIGMTDAQLARIYEPFVQADASTTRRFGGTGLGMSITRHLVDLLGGRLTIRSTVGEGTTVTIRIPVQRRAPRALLQTRAAVDGQKLKVLVVDDDPAAANLLEETFVAGGYDVETAATPAEAIAAMRASPPDLVTLDILLEGHEGRPLLDMIRAQPGGADLPVVLCSVLDGQRLAIAFGADAYLPKPIRREELLSVVESLVPDRACGVLVVDDDPNARDLLGRRLSAAGYHIYFAADGEQALRALDRHRPALVLLDLMMPRVDGFEVLSRVRGRGDALAEIPVIIVTAKHLSREDHAELPDVKAVLEKGVFSTDDLLREVGRAVGAAQREGLPPRDD